MYEMQGQEKSVTTLSQPLFNKQQMKGSPSMSQEQETQHAQSLNKKDTGERIPSP
jgi:hypothetical protein